MHKDKGGNCRTHLRLNDLQVPDLDATRREIRDFELDIDGSLALGCLARTTHAAPKPSCHAAAMLVVAFDRWQAKLGSHQVFFAAAKLLDLPNDRRLLGRIMHRSNVRPETW